jgi:hypothetical protein
MARRLVTLIALVVVVGLVIGAYFYGRDHPAGSSQVAATTTTIVNTTPTQISCGTSTNCLTITGKSGDAITVTLEGEEKVSDCNTPQAGGGSYIVVLAFDNTGSSILTTNDNTYEDAVTLIDTSSTAYTTDEVGSCGYQDAAVALPECKNSAYILDLTPGSNSVWCPLVTFPSTSTLTKIQFDATDFFSPAFSQAGINNAITWNVSST